MTQKVEAKMKIDSQVVGGPSSSGYDRGAADCSDESEDDKRLVGEELVLIQSSFKPLFLISEWKDTYLCNYLPVVVCLPSGVRNNHDKYQDGGGKGPFDLKLINGGSSLQIRVIWPRP